MIVDLLDSQKLDLEKMRFEKTFVDIAKLKAEGNRHTVLLLLTDIMKEGSEMLVISDKADLTEKAYGIATVDGKVWLDGVLSRKKQVVPPLQDSLV